MIRETFIKLITSDAVQLKVTRWLVVIVPSVGEFNVIVG